jgi:hypothetical protein
MKAYSERPDSAKAKMLERMKARSVKPVSKPEDTAKPTEAAKPAAKSAEAVKPSVAGEEDLLEENLSGKSPVESKEGETAPVEGDKPAEAQADPKNPKAKVNPWKLAEEHKAARAQAEKEIVELKKLFPNAEARKAELAEVTALKQRNEELEKHIKYVDFKQSKEYKETYEKPYVDQWKVSMKELNGVTVADDEMGARAIEPKDVLDLVNLPTIKARQMAKELFGEYADDVMRERDKIVTLHNAKATAEESAKQEGMEKFNQTTEAQRTAFETLNKEVHSTYEKAIQSIKSSPANKEFFEPVEGDEEANIVLQKGIDMVERAFSQNPMDPSLNAEQRTSITKLHAAVRFRAIGYGRLKQELARERQAHAANRKKLEQYESTVPNRGPSTPAAVATTNGGSKMSQMQQRLRQRAAAGRGA